MEYAELCRCYAIIMVRVNMCIMLYVHIMRKLLDTHLTALVSCPRVQMGEN